VGGDSKEAAHAGCQDEYMYWGRAIEGRSSIPRARGKDQAISSVGAEGF
jgi:hypothetical protein